ncbi:Protein N-terminal glutamine amidohydrolase [Platanthera zijinensis]|uniref:Protein N-terminal glutamine amidohydrolase n=1 Tax=Platanthera zijinensis TaxID=2320716 RepID=A0AAP0BLE3_9ASPA
MAECSKVEDGRGDAGDTVSANLSTGPSCSGTDLLPAWSSFTHTPFYCEENVYLLCKKLSMLGLADPSALDLFVVFISNEDKKLFKTGNQKRDKESLIWDLDSSLSFPLPLGKYVSETFRQQLLLKSTFRRILRVIHAPIFLRHFASNRTHMRDSLGNWISPPPSYEPIIAHDGSENNIDEYIRMHAADVVTNINAAALGLYSSKYGVLIHEAMLQDFIALLRGAS